MSKKNSNVNLKNGFKNFEDLFNVFQNFKNKLDSLSQKSFIVAVSGGPDSLALVALTKAYSYFKKTKFHYILINHNIRKNSSKEASRVKNLLKKHKINLKIILNKKKIFKNIQANARSIRYDILSNYCKKNKVKIIITAHNLEDQVETFFIRLSRGSGLKGLSAMSPISKINKNISLYRPLLEIKKVTLIKISKKIFGKYFLDPSNQDLKFLRTKIRNLRRPLEKSGILYDQIFKSINNLALSKKTLDDYLAQILRKNIKKKDNEVFINFKQFKELNNEVKIAIIQESIKKLKDNYYNTRSKKVSNLIHKIMQKNYKRSTLGGCIFFIKNGKLCLKIEKT